MRTALCMYKTWRYCLAGQQVPGGGGPGQGCRSGQRAACRGGDTEAQLGVSVCVCVWGVSPPAQRPLPWRLASGLCLLEGFQVRIWGFRAPGRRPEDSAVGCGAAGRQGSPCDVMGGRTGGEASAWKGCVGGVSQGFWGVGLRGHRFWQHWSLAGFCPSLVGGTLMSTTLLPGESSWAARSAICFWDTMR